MAVLLTRRRDQVDARKAIKAGRPVACADQLIGGILFCGSAAGRHAWIRRLNERHPSRFNYFVCFQDVQSPWALSFGFAEWVAPGSTYIDW